MKKGNTDLYHVGDGLYVNLTNRCSNACSFCIRKNGDGAYGSESLWLEKEADKMQIIVDIFEELRRNPAQCRELVFCGYGEPTERLSDLLFIAGEVKKQCPTLPVRLNTNGHASLIAGRDVTPLFQGLFDTVSVSLNAPDAESYDRICKSRYGKAAFEATLRFARDVAPYVGKVTVTVVGDFLTPDELEATKRLCEENRLSLRVREYIG